MPIFTVSSSFFQLIPVSSGRNWKKPGRNLEETWKKQVSSSFFHVPGRNRFLPEETEPCCTAITVAFISLTSVTQLREKQEFFGSEILEMLRARRPRPPYRAYSQENLVEALNKIQNGGNCVRATSKQYDIPKTTLLDKLSGKRPVYTTQGPKPVMTPEEETRSSVGKSVYETSPEISERAGEALGKERAMLSSSKLEECVCKV
ncbi:hypothetical protein BSL78_09839 [Apostichopus japonicus]|uniref:HTH psq-type domain-containing protein n=1 Tax=Stichopus japonicus TaxID=307972 RepID=A0A2G8KZ69_STIJA|nr:hypothetical protein BSL78_09839 [Apostichopus japonicus]